jgi:hypothetical protein
VSAYPNSGCETCARNTTTSIRARALIFNITEKYSHQVSCFTQRLLLPRQSVWGAVAMTKVFIDVVLFSCMFALVTGVVFAAAHVLG